MRPLSTAHIYIYISVNVRVRLQWGTLCHMYLEITGVTKPLVTLREDMNAVFLLYESSYGA